MKGTLVNVAAVILGSLAGIFFSRFLTDKIKEVIIQGLGLTVMLIGISMALVTENVIIVTVSMILGGIVGEVLKIEDRLDNLGENIKKKTGSKSGTFVTGFVTASLVFCVGAMAVVGSLNEGIRGDPYILYVKSLLDGIAAVAFASTLGIGVAFSAITVFVYQGSLTLLGMYLERFLTDRVIAELTATGGLLILGIGINLIFGGNDIAANPDKDSAKDREPTAPSGQKNFKIKVGNLLPALVFAVVITLLLEAFFK